MKAILTLFTALFFCTSCLTQEPNDLPDSKYKPVMMSRNELNQSIKFLPAQQLINAEKYLTKGDTIFAMQPFEGIHVIDNQNPEMPVQLGFINVPGVSDFALKGTKILANQSVDLIEIEWKNSSANLKFRKENFNKELSPPDNIVSSIVKNRPDSLVIVKWIEK